MGLRAGALVAAVVILAGIGIVIASGDDEPQRGDAGAKQPTQRAPAHAPNLVVVMVDDQALSTFDRETMPATMRLFAEEGTVFDQAIAAAPLCCPSRAGFLTGRYAHNHGVVENTIGYRAMSGKGRTFPVALQAAGYRTAMVGKFLNGYEPLGGTEPAPGFDRWYSLHGYADYFNFQVSDDGELTQEPGYATSVLTRKAVDFVGQASEDDAPFFLWLSYNAPHTVLPGYDPPCDGLAAQPPSARAYERFADEPLPRPPSFDERDVSDKRAYDSGPGRLEADEVTGMRRAWRCARAALWGVDRGVRRFVAELERLGELEQTVLVYLSDNGYFYGEHRIDSDKRLPLEPALRIPLAIRVGDSVAPERRPGRAAELVSQVDLAPTLLDYAGVDPCSGRPRCPLLDGRSLRPLLERRSGWPRDRAIPMELDDGWTYRALRTPSHLYLELDATRRDEFAVPELELYDLQTDSHQLENLSESDDPDIRELLSSLGARLERLRGCAGIDGRDPPSAPTFCE